MFNGWHHLNPPHRIVVCERTRQAVRRSVGEEPARRFAAKVFHESIEVLVGNSSLDLRVSASVVAERVPEAEEFQPFECLRTQHLLLGRKQSGANHDADWHRLVARIRKVIPGRGDEYVHHAGVVENREEILGWDRSREPFGVRVEDVEIAVGVVLPRVVEAEGREVLFEQPGTAGCVRRDRPGCGIESEYRPSPAAAAPSPARRRTRLRVEDRELPARVVQGSWCHPVRYGAQANRHRLAKEWPCQGFSLKYALHSDSVGRHGRNGVVSSSAYGRFCGEGNQE